MKEIPISEFKAKCLTVLKQVQKTKRPIRITRFGKAIAEIVPPSPVFTSDWMGSMKDEIAILGDIIAPADELNDWEVLKSKTLNLPGQRRLSVRPLSVTLSGFPGSPD